MSIRLISTADFAAWNHLAWMSIIAAVILAQKVLPAKAAIDVPLAVAILPPAGVSSRAVPPPAAGPRTRNRPAAKPWTRREEEYE